MSLVVGTNSWVTIVEADAYLENRFGAASWFALTDTAGDGLASKENYLITAYYWLVSDPRFALSPTLTSDYVKNAQIEAALFLLLNYNDYAKRSALVTTGVEEFTFSKWKEKLSGDIGKPPIVEDWLARGGYSSGTYLEQITVD